jgi:hypothetical protein
MRVRPAAGAVRCQGLLSHVHVEFRREHCARA